MIKLADFNSMTSPFYVNAALFARGILEKVPRNCEGSMCITSPPCCNEELEELIEFAGFLAKHNWN